MKYKKAYQST